MEMHRRFLVVDAHSDMLQDVLPQRNLGKECVLCFACEEAAVKTATTATKLKVPSGRSSNRHRALICGVAHGK